MLNYITVMNRFWQIRRRHFITSYQADLFIALVQECNERRWLENPFLCKNDRLCSLTNMSDSAMKDARSALRELQLIGYQPGIANSRAPWYKLYAEDADYDADSEDHDTPSWVANSAVKNPRKPPIILNKTNQMKTFAPFGASAESAGREKKSEPTPADNQPDQQRFAPEKEKSSAQKEKEPERPVPYWRAITSKWFEFNQEQLHIRPSFKGRDPKALREIMLLLEKRSAAAGLDWTEESAVRELASFLRSAWQEEQFLRKKFLLKNLEAEYDSIIANQHNGTFATVPAGRIAGPAEQAQQVRRRGATLIDILQTQRPGSPHLPQ